MTFALNLNEIINQLMDTKEKLNLLLIIFQSRNVDRDKDSFVIGGMRAGFSIPPIVMYWLLNLKYVKLVSIV